MKKIGILGGMSPESTVPYYLNIIHSYIKQFGNDNFPEIIIYSVTFEKEKDWSAKRDWNSINQYLGSACQSLEKAGADFIIIATNTIHTILPGLQAQIHIPILSIMDAVGEEIRKFSFHSVGLLGTKFTMEDTFYQNALNKFDISVITPDLTQQAIIHNVIFHELSRNILIDTSRSQFLDIIESLADRGAEGIILGCTEIPLLIKQENTKIKVFDSMQIHSRAALKFALD